MTDTPTLECLLPWTEVYYPTIENALLEAGFDIDSPYSVEVLANGDRRYFQ